MKLTIYLPIFLSSGRAETWDTDSKGIPKGEHNHTTEHDLAELEYFKVLRQNAKQSNNFVFRVN